MVNKQVLLISRPSGSPGPENFRLTESPMPAPGDGEVLLKTLYLSVDPYMRGRMNDAKSYAAPAQLGQPMVGGGVCEVIQSGHADFQVGDIVLAGIGWQEYGIAKAQGLRKIDPTVAPISTALGVLGMPGMTAFFGLLDIGQPKAGETVVVSGAAGAVGELVGQIAKIMGCRVIGIAGSDEKVAYLRQIGFDAAYNYKTVTDHAATLRELAPAGIDVYFDNVGGEITDAVFRLLNTFGRVAVCGQIAHYNDTEQSTGPRWLPLILSRQIRIEGFIVSRFETKRAQFTEQMAHWLREGRISYREDVVEGIEQTPTAFLGLLQGKNQGKMLVKVASPGLK